MQRGRGAARCRVRCVAAPGAHALDACGRATAHRRAKPSSEAGHAAAVNRHARATPHHRTCAPERRHARWAAVQRARSVGRAALAELPELASARSSTTSPPPPSRRCPARILAGKASRRPMETHAFRHVTMLLAAAPSCVSRLAHRWHVAVCIFLRRGTRQRHSMLRRRRAAPRHQRCACGARRRGAQPATAKGERAQPMRAASVDR